MAYPIWQATITDDNGNVLPGAEITVVNEETGLNATLYSTRNGTSKTNPFFATVDGFAQFYAAPGLYRITATDGGTGTTQTFRYVRLVEVATPAEAIAGTAGVLPDAAGAHAAFGQYGLGSKGTTLGNNFDFNSAAAMIDGSWRLEDSPVNGPSWGAGFCQLRVTRGSGDTVNQTVYDYISNRISFRNGGTQVGDTNDIRNKPWVDLLSTRNMVGTVSQSGGVPTGAIIERGTNANGEFVRYADGTQICRRAYGLSVTDTGSFVVGSVTCYRIRDLWTFPIPFSTTTSLIVLSEVNQNSDNVFVSTKNRDLTVSGVNIDSLSAISFSAFARSATYAMAIGRWY